MLKSDGKRLMMPPIKSL